MWERIRVILRKEFIQALREPRMRILLFVPPILQSIIFGFAVNLGTDSGHSTEGIHPGATRAAHADSALRAADSAVDHLRVRRESGRRPREHRVDGHGPHAGEPGYALGSAP